MRWVVEILDSVCRDREVGGRDPRQSAGIMRWVVEILYSVCKEREVGGRDPRLGVQGS